MKGANVFLELKTNTRTIGQGFDRYQKRYHVPPVILSIKTGFPWHHVGEHMKIA